jgi:alcohol dehydrogenase class IV
MTLTDLRHRTAPSRTFCGEGCLRRLAREIDSAGVSRVVVVSSGSARRHRAFSRVAESLGDRAVTVFDGVREHTPLPVVESLAEIVRSTGAQGLVAVGGGSAVVTARAVAIAYGEQLPVAEMATRKLPDGTFHSPRPRSRDRSSTRPV